MSPELLAFIAKLLQERPLGRKRPVGVIASWAEELRNFGVQDPEFTFELIESLDNGQRKRPEEYAKYVCKIYQIPKCAHLSWRDSLRMSQGGRS